MILITNVIDLIFVASFSRENALVQMLVLIDMRCQNKENCKEATFSRASETDVS